MRMPFGKYAGEPLKDIPDSYLRWLLTIELTPWLRAAVLDELRSRSPRQSGPRQDRPHASPPAPRWAEVVGTVRRRLAMQHHPDRGGDPAVMKAVNAALDLVLEVAGV